MSTLPSAVESLLATLDHSGDGLFVFDLEGRLYAVNATARNWINQSEAEQILRTQGLKFYLSQEQGAALSQRLQLDAEELIDATQRSDTQALPIRIELPRGKNARSDDNRTLEIDLTVLVQDSERLIHVLGIARDISPRVRIEHALDGARLAAEATSAAKTDILYSVSHDIRTPLNGALGFLELLRKTGLDKRQCGYVDTVERSTRSMMSIIDQLLDVARIEAGYIDLNPQPADLVELLENCVQLHRPLAAAKNLELRFLAEDNEAYVQVDAARLAQITNNLITNAIKFTQSGSVEVLLKLRVVDDACQVEIAVRDTGIGIYPDEMELLFTAYERSQRALTRRAGGIGLGLSISQRLVQGMGGTIHVDSVPNEGSNFSIALTLQRAQRPPLAVDGETRGLLDRARARAKRRADKRKIHALAVDDSDINLNYMVTLLRYHNVVVTPAIGGQAAIDALDVRKPDLVILDIHMPAIDGYDVLRAIDERYPIVRPPVIALTADASSDSRANIEHAGFDDVIFKPASEQDFLMLLHRHVGIGAAVARQGTRTPLTTLDIDKIFGIQMAGGDEFLWRKNLHLFTSRLPDALRQIEQANPISERKLLADSAHRIAGTASYLGAGTLADSARVLQDSARDTREPDLVEPIGTFIKVANAFLNAARNAGIDVAR